MRVALYARVSTRDKDQNPETQLRQLREQATGTDVELVGEFVDKASPDGLRGRRRRRELLELAQRRQVDLIVVWRRLPTAVGAGSAVRRSRSGWFGSTGRVRGPGDDWGRTQVAEALSGPRQ